MLQGLCFVYCCTRLTTAAVVAADCPECILQVYGVSYLSTLVYHTDTLEDAMHDLLYSSQ